MSWRLIVANGLLLGGIIGVLGVGTESSAIELLPAGDAGGEVGRLEASAATAPTPAVVAGLATAYLDQRQPGLALALIDRAPAEIQAAPEVGIVHARATFSMGEPDRALAIVREVAARCDETSATPGDCTAWVRARASLQRDFFEEVVAAGIADPEREPGATLAAHRRSAREVRLAMR